MKKSRLKDQTHTRKDVFVYAIEEKDLPASSSKTLPSKMNKQYMVTITFDNGKFLSVKHGFPQNRDQRALYKVFADINEEIDRIADTMDTDASIQEMIKVQEIEEKRSPGKKLVQVMKNNSRKKEVWDITGKTSRLVTGCLSCGDENCFDLACKNDDLPF